jgi:Na+/H+ antiporter NhaD/arsenite permease-like protein
MTGESAVVHHHVYPSITFLFSAILVLMVLGLAFEEKLHCKKSLITGIFAAICLPLGLLCNILPIGPLQNQWHELVKVPLFIPAVDWEVIEIILGSALFVDVVSRSGLFSWLAIKLTKRSGGNPRTLLIYYGCLTVLFSAFLNNVTAIIIIGSLSAVSLDRLKKLDLLLSFLLVEGLLTNVGGLLTLISSVPNIIAGNIAGISFVNFFLVAAPYVAVVTVVTIFLGIYLFKIPGLKDEEERKEARELVEGFDENDGIESLRFFWGSVVALLLLIALFATGSFIPILKDLGLGYIAMTFALVMLLVYRSDVHRFYAGIDWDLIGFFVFLFIVINVMEHAQVLALLGKAIAKLVQGGDYSGRLALLWGAAITSSVTDNIPLTAVLAKILGNWSPRPDANSPLWWSVIFGANLGGNITPIGSASTLVAVAIMHKHKVPLSFIGFVKKAFPFAAIHLVLASVYVVVAL